jgi:hypothetical protein
MCSSLKRRAAAAMEFRSKATSLTKSELPRSAHRMIHRRPAAVIIGFEDEDDWLDWLLLHDEAFMERMAESMRQYHREEYATLDAL